jgi:hypothetical protein
MLKCDHFMNREINSLNQGPDPRLCDPVLARTLGFASAAAKADPTAPVLLNYNFAHPFNYIILVLFQSGMHYKIGIFRLMKRGGYGS